MSHPASRRRRPLQHRGRLPRSARSCWALALALGLAGALALSAGRARAQQLPRSQACVACHLKQSDKRLSQPARLFPTDIHAQKGFGCLDCHGRFAAGTHGVSGGVPEPGFLSKPARKDIPALCGRCHSDAAFMKRYNPSLRVDQVTEYLTSDHGRRLFQADDPDVATCIDCHPAHSIRPPTDPASSVHPLNVARTCGRCHGDPKIMGRHHIPATPVADYGQSVHARLLYKGGDLSAPTCNDCHGNHGAVPPGVDAVRNVCGQCHATMADYFSASGHAGYFARAGLPGCVTCHGNHAIRAPSDALLVVAGRRVCARCHTGADAAGFGRMSTLLRALEQDSARGATLLAQAENDGMEVSQAQFELRDISTVFTRARGAVHSFNADTLAHQLAAGHKLTDNAVRRGREALREHRFRREGLAFSSTFILALVVGLLVKVRRLDGARETFDPTGGRSHARGQEDP